MSEVVLPVIGIVLGVVGFVCVLFGSPLLMFYTLKMGRRRIDDSRTWHDLWGLNRNNLIFFPELLDEQGKKYQKLAVKGAKIMFLGIAAATVSMLLGTFGPLAQ